MQKTTCAISAMDVFGTSKTPQNLNEVLKFQLTDHSYLPKIQEPRADWVMSVALPAFRAYAIRAAEEGRKVEDFCTIGTGAGMDALAAAEVFSPATVTVTDIHKDVVENALKNIASNLIDPQAILVEGYVGDLTSPLLATGKHFDLIYENLPNIPLPEGISLSEGQRSSSFMVEREGTPHVAKLNLLELHYALLRMAKPLLKPGGRVLCSIGGRCSIASIMAMVVEAGYWPRTLTYRWKVQSEPGEVIVGYAAQQRKGFGPFFFYPTEDLRSAFARFSPSSAALEAYMVEQRLSTKRVDAEAAERLYQDGHSLGHTVVVIEAVPNSFLGM